jgi:hypothetical protein
MLRRIVLFVPFFLLIAATSAPAQAVAPPPPATYDLQIRYQIEAFRNERVAQFFEMMRDFKRAGFVRDPDEQFDDNEPENPRANHMQGSIAPDRVPALLKQRHVRTIRLVPGGGVKLPGPDEQVRVHLDLTAGLPADKQRQLYQDARLVLTALGFVEATGYDHRGFSHLVGVIPVKSLDTLFYDLRRQPQAWKMLSKTLLSDLRSYQGGRKTLEDILTEWYEHKEGRKLVLDVLAVWQLTPEGRKVMAGLPIDFANNPESPVAREQLFVSLIRSNDNADVLSQLLASVYADPAAKDLVDRMVRRINNQAGGGGMPQLFRGGSTVRVIEVFPEMPPPALRRIAPPVAPGLEKITPDLRELLTDESKAATPVRLEVILALTPAEDREPLARQLAAEYGIIVEGRLGPVITVVTTLGIAKKLAAFDEVAVIRFPRLPQPLPLVPQAPPKPLPLAELGVARLHAMGHRGQGVVVAVLDPDFRGWDAMLAEKKLPKETRLVDLTRERHPRMIADPFVGDPQQLGAGTRYAMTIAAVAPEAEILLVRVDPQAPYMIQNVARTINGEGYHSFGLEQRFLALTLERGTLDHRKDLLLEQRKNVYSGTVEITEEDKKRPEYQKMKMDRRSLEEITQWLQEKKREEYRERQAEYERDEADYQARVKLYFKIQEECNDLKRVRVAVSSLVWDEGFPVDGSGTLSRYFDDRPFKAALWFQAGGDARGQAWTGLFRDEDGSGTMKFAAAERPFPKGLWSHENNFLKWKSVAGDETLDLPANVKLRLVLQWREAHDPLYLQIGEDRYREPLANLRLVLVHQPDPAGAKRPSDDLEVVAESVGPPARLLAHANSATYEQILEFTVKNPGRYAVRIEGRLPDSVVPRGAPTLPSARTFGELRPRLFVRTLDGPGRAQLHTYWTDAGSLGMPSDSHQVIAVGAIDREKVRQPYGSRGPAQGMELLVKPDLLAYDDIDGVVFGSGQAAALTAGVAAVTQNGNAPVQKWMKTLGLQPGKAIRVPETWPR